ncbi:unnamed protein product [Urochloa humidicola]
MAQWSTAASLARWSAPPCCGSPPPCKAAVPGVPLRRPARREGRIGCASVPRELDAAEQTAMPVVVEDPEKG